MQNLENVVLAHVATCNALKFFSRILRSEALGYNTYFQNTRFTES